MIAEEQQVNQLHQVAASAWNPSPPVNPREWCGSRVRLSPDYEAGGGGYDLRTRPWWQEILESYLDPEVRSVVIPASTQVGKTLGVIAGILWCAENSPAPGLAVLPDQGTAMEFRDRVYANAIESRIRGGFQRITIPPQHLWNSRWIDLGSMRVYLAWSGSRQRLRGRACQRTWLIEVDVYKGDKKAGNPIEATHQRTKAFYDFLHYHESSPTEYPSAVIALEKACTDHRRWHAKCPQCGRYQELRFFPYRSGDLAGRGGFGGLQNEHGEWLSPEEARKLAHYVCMNGCQVASSQKQQMLEAGQWISQTQKIKRDGTVSGKRPSRRSVGYHLWSVHSDTTSFGDIAAAYLEAREQGTIPEFWGNWLGLEYRQEGKLPTWKQLGRRMAWTHQRGTVPHQCWFLTAGADVQGGSNGVFYTVRGWAPGCTSWLVDWGWLEREEGDENDLVKSDLRKLTKVLGKQYLVVGVDGRAENPLGKISLPIRLLNIDSNHRPMDVHAWMQSLPEHMIRGDAVRVRAVRGDHKVDPSVRYRMHVVEQNTRTGAKYEGGLEQWGIYVYHFYQDLVERISGAPNKSGSWYVTKDAIAAGKSYLQQVTNFHRVVEVNEKTGKKKGVWKPRSGQIDVDYWDCETYSLVAAHMVVGDLGWREENWRTWWTNTKQTKRRRRREPAGAGEYGGIDDR
jgi:phage terminase large subunit GpA-like protein